MTGIEFRDSGNLVTDQACSQFAGPHDVVVLLTAQCENEV